MFSKKPHSDIKKSSQKVLDSKKDSLSRLKHLRIVLENSDTTESKAFFENNYSHIYNIFYDVFITVESNLRQRAHHRTHREELEVVRFIFEKLLLLLPELLNRRWQCHSIQRIIKKFLHSGNSLKIRREGIRLFLLWYQILGDNAPEDTDILFTTIVPGLVPGIPNSYVTTQNQGQPHGAFRGQVSTIETYPETSTFYTPSATDDTGPVCPGEILPILPPLSAEQQPEDATRYFLDSLMEFMVSQVCRIEWKEKADSKFQKCFNFLFEKFKKYYLPHIFPYFSPMTNLYSPCSDIPGLRSENDIKYEHDISRFSHRDSLYQCQSIIVRWITHFTQSIKKANVNFLQSIPAEMAEQNDAGRTVLSGESEASQSSGSLLSSGSVILERDPSNTSIGNDDLSLKDYSIVRDILFSSRENINLIQEVFHQAFLMEFGFASTMRKVVGVYREWIHKSGTDKPLFLEDPPTEIESGNSDVHDIFENSNNSLNSSSLEDTEVCDSNMQEMTGLRLRKDSYLKAIHSDHAHLKAGIQNTLKVFISNAANVFLLDVTENIQMLEEQVDMCKRVLNIYRYMVMNVQMERRVWEQLLLVLLQITSMVLREAPPCRKEDSLGGRLAPALFQTLIVTWIKANLNVVISTELWDKFLCVLSSLTQWEELIREWAKTMETLTRVLAKQVYCLDLNNLPLDRLSERTIKKNRGMKKPSNENFEKKNDRNLDNRRQFVGPQSYNNGSVYDDSASQETGHGSFQESSRMRSGSGDTSQKRERTFETIRKSASDTNLSRKSRNHQIPRQLSACQPMPKQILFVTGASPSREDELPRFIPQFEQSTEELLFHNKTMYSRQKSKSLDYLSHRAESPCFSESSECHSRSPSPTPSSGIENTSIKDSPMQIDVLVSSTENSCNNSDAGNTSSVETQSIMSGGTTRGWLSDVAVVLWKRMLGVLGDVNLIKDANIHAQVMKHLLEFSKLLMKLRDNLGVSVDNHSSPPPPELAPPLLLIVPWLFQAINLPEKYKQGKLLAYELLCILTISHHDLIATKDYLIQFYDALHYGLSSNDQDLINTTIKSCGSRFFSACLPGSMIMLLDFISGINTIISSNLKGMPRTEAVSILGSLVCLPNTYQDILTLQPSSSDLITLTSNDAKGHITAALFKSGRREPCGIARCIAISSIGIFVYEELMNKTNHCGIKEGISVLLTAVRFNCKTVAQVASDMLLLLSDHADVLIENYSDFLQKIIEVLSSTLSNLLPVPETSVSDEEKKLILSLIYCLGEWCMHTNQNFLTMGILSPEDACCPLLSVFKVLNQAAGKQSPSFTVPLKSVIPQMHDLETDAILSMPLDTSLENSVPKTPMLSKNITPSHKPASSNDSYFFRPLKHQKEADCNVLVIKLAARNVLNQIVNHLSHFPMGVGAVRLSSLVNEHDDVPSLTGDELSSDVFHAPNIQFFVLNNCSIISFVEIPSLEVPGGGASAGLATSKSQVRVIIRDLGGKFSWDCSILYGTPDCSGGSYIPESDIISCLNNSNIYSSSHSSLSSFQSSGYFTHDQNLNHLENESVPKSENIAQNMENLDELLHFVGCSSPECITKPVLYLNCPPKLLCEESKEKEMETINLVLDQRNRERAQLQKYSGTSSMEPKKFYPPYPCERSSLFQHCRLLLNQLGYTSWEKRSCCDLLKKNEQLLRELRNLDKQKCRETHKFAVIYVAEGQEDKNSILRNSGGSQEFEEFVAGLGWEVELGTHLGFLGGLQRNKSTGDSAPYYATSFLEVIFHVSTRMSTCLDDESMNKKVRHLGNDEVHIVWSEHFRDYRKEIIATEFCDVLIAIYPIGGRLYRIHISRKSEVPFFGPLFDGAIVEHKVLSGLVRATAINASRAMRSLVSLYQNFYEERARSLEIIVQNHKDRTTFEQFASSVYSPAPSKMLIFGISSGPPSRSDSACSRGIPNLAAALLDAQGKGDGFSPNLKNRPVSQSTTDCLSQHSPPVAPLRDRPLSASHG